MSKKKDTARFINRELSWIAFNRRVLGEALNERNPLLERLKFLCIVSNNFDEFFMVRVASLLRQIRRENFAADPAGMSPQQQLQAIRTEVTDMLVQQYDCFNQQLVPALAREGIRLVPPSAFDSEQNHFITQLFEQEVFPILSPVRIDPRGYVPYIGNLRLHAAFLIQADPDSRTDGSDGPLAASEDPVLVIVRVPRSLSRIIYLPGEDTSFALLEQVILSYAPRLFPGCRILERAVFRVTRDADFSVDEERDEDFVEAMEQVVETREQSRAVRLTINQSEGRIREQLTEALEIPDDQVYTSDDPLDLSAFMKVTGLPGYDELRYPTQRPRETPELPADQPVWESLAHGDALLYHPYESFAPVVRLLQDAATDPGVLAIKMTLYRTSGSSPIIKALEEAAENGKQVTVLVELKARFDEERNIGWAHRLEQAGAIVVFGIARLKVHAKAMMIVRRERNRVVRYVHMGTGNYNDKTATLYTDIGYLTSREDIAYEASLFFNAITGYSAIPVLKQLIMAPAPLKARLIAMIDREAARSSTESPGRIQAKLNSLSDTDVIEALYRASKKGVQIELNIRGICMLVPGVKGLSEHIRVTSIVGRYLEHARVVYFQNGGSEEYYLSSADWMSRNLERRVELMFPIDDTRHQRHLRRILDAHFADSFNAHELAPDGSWTKVRPDGSAFSSQQHLYERAAEREHSRHPANTREFNVRRKAPGSNA